MTLPEYDREMLRRLATLTEREWYALALFLQGVNTYQGGALVRMSREGYRQLLRRGLRKLLGTRHLSSYHDGTDRESLSLANSQADRALKELRRTCQR
jgi:hypothetical protein